MQTISLYCRNYENRVSFDTFDNRDATDLSFTLISKHKDYVYTPRSRTFLCGADQNDYSEFALDWLIDELVEDGDEIVCLRVLDKDSKINSESNLQEGKYRTEARNLLDHIQNKNKEDAKSISLVLEFAVGKVAETIQRMVCFPKTSMPPPTAFLTDASVGTDHHLFARLPYRRHTGSFARRDSRASSRLRLEILPANLSGSCGRGPSVGQAREEKEETACGPEPTSLHEHPGKERCCG